MNRRLCLPAIMFFLLVLPVPHSSESHEEGDDGYVALATSARARMRHTDRADMIPRERAAGLSMTPEYRTRAPQDVRDQIDLVEIEPPAGTVLQAGETVTFRATVSYRLATTDAGEVGMVVQGQVETPGGIYPQHGVNVTRGSRTITISQEATVARAGPATITVFLALAPALPTAQRPTTSTSAVASASYRVSASGLETGWGPGNDWVFVKPFVPLAVLLLIVGLIIGVLGRRRTAVSSGLADSGGTGVSAVPAVEPVASPPSPAMSYLETRHATPSVVVARALLAWVVTTVGLIALAWFMVVLGLADGLLLGVAFLAVPPVVTLVVGIFLLGYFLSRVVPNRRR